MLSLYLYIRIECRDGLLLLEETHCSLFSINDLILSGWVFISINRKFVFTLEEAL